MLRWQAVARYDVALLPVVGDLQGIDHVGDGDLFKGAFDDFAGGSADEAANRRILGLSP